MVASHAALRSIFASPRTVSYSVALAIAGLLNSDPVLALGEVTSLNTSTSAGTVSSYSDGTNTYSWGLGNDLTLDGFTYNGNNYTYSVSADNTVLRRSDSTTACSIFAETDGTDYNFLGSQPTGTGTQCDMARVMAGNVINAGVLDVFANTGVHAKNLERIDFLFTDGITAPIDASLLASTGHVVAEKSGNNPVKIVAITAIDPITFEPTAFQTANAQTIESTSSGNCLTSICYGITPTNMNFSFLYTADDTIAPSWTFRSTESLGMAFVSLSDLGISAGQTYYGFSLYAPDVDETTNPLTDITTFPTNTDSSAALGDADLYGGTAGYFVLNNLRTLSGTVYIDTDQSGSQNGSEAGIPNITVSIYSDINSNGSYDAGTDTLVGSVESNGDGEYSTSVADGTYFLQADSNDTDLPTSGVIPVSFRTITAVVSGAAVSGLDTPVFTTPLPALLAADDSITTGIDTAATVAVIANDSGSISSVVIATQPTNGNASVNGNSIVYTPTSGFSGTDSFTYTITDTGGNTDTATVTIAVFDDPDNDGDGIPDIVDLDDDNDGILDSKETGSDFDGDGIPNWFDLDSDNDGIPDIEESGLTMATKLSLDTDHDGRFDLSNNFGANGLINALEITSESGQPDYDGDGNADDPVDTDANNAPDFLDLDSDNDGLRDVIEAGFADADGNGAVDNFTDTDGDGWDTSAQDAYLNANGLLTDADNNGIPDYCECGCEGAPIHTAVSSHGGGAMGWMLLPLAAAGFRRRMRKALPAAVATALVAGAAHADNALPTQEMNQRFYLGLGAGVSMLDPEPECNCVNVNDDSDTALKFFAGYDISKRFSAELYYADLGEAGLSQSAGGVLGTIGYQQYGISLLTYIYNHKNEQSFRDHGLIAREGISVYARVGAGATNNDSSLSIEQDNSAHLHLGAGLEYGWANGVAFRGEFVSYTDDAKGIFVSLVKRFGSATTPLAMAPLVPVVAPAVKASSEVRQPKPALPSFELPIVHFEHDESDLADDDKSKLEDLSKALKPRPEVKLEVRGHTDSDGSSQYNQGLSERRAEEVKIFLESNGTAPNQLVPRGYGEERPAASNATSEGKQKNRRVDFKILED